MALAAISYILVTYNSAADITDCLAPLTPQLMPKDEVIVVDNASQDNTVAQIRKLMPNAEILTNTANLGFAGACNQGANRARNDLLVFLNPDSIPARDFHQAIQRPLEHHPEWTIWMGFVTQAGGERVNTSGGIVHFTGLAWTGDTNLPVAQSNRTPRTIGFASGACLAVRRGAWTELGGFPAHYFMYCEDVDLSLRSWLTGGSIGVEPSAIVDHSYEFAKGNYKWRLLERNRWATILRTYPAALLWLLLPALLVTEVAILLAACTNGWGKQKVRAWCDLARALPELLAERRAIQASRTLSAREFASHLTAKLDSPYLGRAAGLPGVQTALSVYWAAVCWILRRQRA